MEAYCFNCNGKFNRCKAHLERATTYFCAPKCALEFRQSQKQPVFATSCTNCQKEIFRPKIENKKYFCTTSCGAIYINKNRIRKPPKQLPLCKACKVNTVSRHTKTVCDNCFSPIKNLSMDTLISELQYLASEKQNKNTLIRYHARLVTELWPKKCFSCGYDKHVETCHIKSIGKFQPNQTIGEVNNTTNLVLLCPNCHWEFDHNQLSLDQIKLPPLGIEPRHSSYKETVLPLK